MSRWTILPLHGLLYGAMNCNISDAKILKHISNWFVETPEDSWDIWHMGNI
jgi:hypothetical protein